MFLPLAAARRRSWGPLVAVLFYVTVAQAAAYLHHDAQCHRTSRTHCPSCLFSVVASGVADDDAPAGQPLRPAEPLLGLDPPACVFVPVVFPSDRSPPA
jgi:hypothetical protein